MKMFDHRLYSSCIQHVTVNNLSAMISLLLEHDFHNQAQYPKAPVK